MNNPWSRYPFSFMGKKWSRTFFVGFLAVIAIMTWIDWILADFVYTRIVDALMIAAYGVFWSLLYRLRPDFFKED